MKRIDYTIIHARQGDPGQPDGLVDMRVQPSANLTLTYTQVIALIDELQQIAREMREPGLAKEAMFAANIAYSNSSGADRPAKLAQLRSACANVDRQCRREADLYGGGTAND